MESQSNLGLGLKLKLACCLRYQTWSKEFSFNSKINKTLSFWNPSNPSNRGEYKMNKTETLSSFFWF